MPTSRAVALVTAAALFGDTLLYTALPVSAARLGLDALAVGLALSLNRWVRLLTNPIAARMFERVPAGVLVLVALALAVASTAVYALPAVLVAFLVARLVWGMAWSLFRLGALLSAIEGAGGRAGRALGDMRALFGLGYLGGAIYAPLAVEAFGWGAAALGAAALTLLLGIGPALTVASWRREMEVNEREEAAIRRAILDPRFLALFVVTAIQYAVYAGVVAVAGGLRVAAIFPEGASVVAVPLAATVIAGLFILMQRISQVVWTPFAGRLADRSPNATFMVPTAVSAAAMLALALTHDATAFVALGAVTFFGGMTSVVALELAIAHRTTSVDRPRILGAYNTWADAGAATGALGAGALALIGTDVAIAIAAAATLLTVPTWWGALAVERRGIGSVST